MTGSLDCVFEIGNQVFFILNSDRYAHQIGRQIAFRQHFGRNAGMAEHEGTAANG